MQNEFQNSAHIVDAELVSASTQGKPLRNRLIESLLSPQTLGWMMAVGAILLVSGFSAWLWSIGVFENPLFLAISVTGTNLVLLATGVWLFQGTRFRLAGRGLTMLSSLLLPLNLWLYDSQELLTVAGGKLWIAALKCSVVYAVIARATRDHLFVFTLIGGVAMTGTLFFAGGPGQVISAVLPVATFLVFLGGLSIQADRFFVDGNSDFNRQRFGLAFFRSGHVTLILGVTVLIAGHWMSTFSMVNHATQWTIATLAFSSLVYATSNAVDRRHKVFTVLAAVCGCCAAVQLIQLLNIELTLRTGALALTTVAVAANVYRQFFEFESAAQQLVHVGFVFAATVLSLAVAATDLAFATTFLFFDWFNIVQLIVASTAIFTLPKNWANQNGNEQLLVTGLTTLCLTLSATSASMGLAITSPANLIAVMSASSLLLTILSAFIERIRLMSYSISFCLSTFSILGLALLLGAVQFGSLISVLSVTLILLSMIVDSYLSGRESSLVLSGLTLKLNLLQTASYLGYLNSFSIISAISIIGLIIGVVAKLSRRTDNKVRDIQLSSIGHTLICVGAAAAFLFTMSDLLVAELSLAHLGLLFSQLLAIGIAASFTTSSAWRKAFLVAAILIVGMGILVHFHLSTLTIFHRIELGSIALGLLMVVAGHIGWARECSDRDDAVSFNLVIGSILLSVPFMIGIVADRMAVEPVLGVWRYIHEIGGLTVGLAMLSGGILCQIRSTTISAATLLSVFVFSNILLFDLPVQLQTTSSIMMIGGGLFFGIAVALSIFRDRIVALPQKIKSGRGIFQVLNWR